jgi:hypothetical protein
MKMHLFISILVKIYEYEFKIANKSGAALLQY